MKEVTFKDWHHQCTDGCCDRFGIDVYIDGESIGSIEDGDSATAEALVELFEEHFKDK